jgi:fermentation-respiration switch protein FrsA (DUF1100 family)
MNKRRLMITGGVVLFVILAAGGWLLNTTRSEAHNLITHPIDTRPVLQMTPATFDLPYEDVLIVTDDGIELVGWFIPAQNGAVIMAQHGYKNNRAEMLNLAAMLHRHGYGILITSVRAHDYSDGELITFGAHELGDLDAWYTYLLTRDDIDHERIGILGNSMGGMLVIGYAAQNPEIKAVVAHSAFSSLEDTTAASVKFYTGLPPFPFVPLILAWGEREGGFEAEFADATQWIGQISPRPVFLIQGGADNVISADSGQKLYDAAGEPKDLWFEPELGHARFDWARPREFESRVIAFYDAYLQ